MLKFYDSIFSKHSGCALVKLKDTKTGEIFYGVSKCHEDDMPYVSEYFGCEIAELRAHIKVFKKQKKEIWKEYKACKNIIAAACNMKAFDSDSSTAKAVFHQLNLKEKEYKAICNKIEIFENIIKEKVRQKDHFNEKYLNESNSDN